MSIEPRDEPAATLSVFECGVDVVTPAPSPVLAPLSPLDRFVSSAALRPEEVPPEAVPEPYRSLLVHDSDMTSTLSTAHGEEIGLRVDEMRAEGDDLLRRVVLVGRASGRPVEFGAIRIALGGFDPASRERIRAGEEPLGSILVASAGSFESAPLAYFRVQTTPLVERALELDVGGYLWGRQNVLTRPSGRVLAEVVEILPPWRGGG